MAANQERDFIHEAATLLVNVRAGTLATLASGKPHAALTTPAVAPGGSVILLLSELAAHTRNLRADPAASLLVTGLSATENPQTAPRLLLSGQMRVTDAPIARLAYLQRHPYAEPYADFADFNFWQLFFKDAHYIGGFAAAGPLNAAALQQEIILLSEKDYG